jgi:hypothetical protein
MLVMRVFRFVFKHRSRPIWLGLHILSNTCLAKFGGIDLAAGFVHALICFYFKHLESIAGERHYRA